MYKCSNTLQIVLNNGKNYMFFTINQLRLRSSEHSANDDIADSRY